MTGSSKVVVTDADRAAALECLLSVALADSQRITLRHDDIIPYFEGLFNESERATAILAFAFIEARICDLFGQQLDGSIQGGVGAILGPQGILESVGAQIKLLRALQWIRPETEHDLRLLAKIRNRFAHAHTALTFEDVKIGGYFSAMTKHEEYFATHYPGAALKCRDKYLVRAAMTLFMVNSDLTLMPSSLRSGLGPTGVFAAGFERYPEALQEVLGTCMAVVRVIHEGAGAAKDEGRRDRAG